MTIVSLTDCCRLLAIDAKTLRRWLSLAHISVQAHPLDARLKCVTWEQVQQVAATHRRILPESSEQPFQAEPSPLSTPPDVRSASVLASVVSDVSTPIMDSDAAAWLSASPCRHITTPTEPSHGAIAKGAGMANKPRFDVQGQVSGIFPGQVSGIFPGQVSGIFPG